MPENILLANVLLLVNAGEYFVGYSLAIRETGNHFVGYCLAICEAGEYSVGNSLAICICWSIFCWLLSSH